MFAGYYGLTPNEACCVCKGYDPPGNFPPPPSRNRFYEFHIDCYMPDESFLQTTATIEIFFWSADHTFLGRDTLQGLRCSSIYADEKVGIFSTTPVEYVEVATRSSDAFLIDEAWLTVDSSYELYHWDEDGSLGYCLSTERDDYITHGWADNLRYPTDGCQPAYFFTRNGVRPLLTVGTS